jgi:hypothetical protein
MRRLPGFRRQQGGRAYSARSKTRRHDLLSRTLNCTPDDLRAPGPASTLEAGNQSDLQGLSWARLGSNQRPLACEASALPLSYAPEGPSRLAPPGAPRPCGNRRRGARAAGALLPAFVGDALAATAGCAEKPTTIQRGPC